MLELKKIEGNMECMNIFDLLGSLKTLVIMDYKEELPEREKIMVEGLVERIQERIVLKLYD